MRQRKGGAIGLRGTGSIARTSMDCWIEKFIEVLETQGVKTYLIKKYVDDVLTIVGRLKLGSRWNGTSIPCYPEDADADARALGT